jgi:hypothetical protein
MLIRLLFLVPFVLVTGWLSVAVSGASLTRQLRPDIALTFRPGDAGALAKSAELLLRQTPLSRASIDAAERLSLDALRRDPTMVVAWRSLGMVAAARQQPAEANRIFHFAAILSKRDLPTRLWLIEERVQADDVPGALREYDIALRGSRAAHQLLLPILVSATSSDAILRPLAALLNEMPPWRRAFLDAYAGGGPATGRFLEFTRLIFPTMSAEEKGRLALALPGLVERRQFQPAYQLYQLLAADARQPQVLRNGGFEQANPYPPLDWQLQNGGEFGAETEAAGGQAGHRLRIFAASGTGGLAARQLLLLPPGSYEIGAVFGPVEDSRPARINWTIQCATGSGAILLRQDLPARAAAGPSAAAFGVPAADCSAQWLNLNVVADFDPGGVAAWLDTLAIRRLGAGAGRAAR